MCANWSSEAAARRNSPSLFTRTCYGMPAATSWPMMAMTLVQFSTTWAIGTFRTRCATRSSVRRGSRTFGKTETDETFSAFAVREWLGSTRCCLWLLREAVVRVLAAPRAWSTLNVHAKPGCDLSADGLQLACVLRKHGSESAERVQQSGRAELYRICNLFYSRDRIQTMDLIQKRSSMEEPRGRHVSCANRLAACSCWQLVRHREPARRDYEQIRVTTESSDERCGAPLFRLGK